jgi:hypothetical protein
VTIVEHGDARFITRDVDIVFGIRRRRRQIALRRNRALNTPRLARRRRL